MDDSEKLTGYKFWEKTLQSAKYVVAPMVDQSELAWRMLSRKYGAELCYSPMYHASVFLRNPHYRRDALASCSKDRPLIIQFCANDPNILVEAALMAQNHCDAIDINLGCPQTIARKGYYGAFLSDNWELVAKLVKACNEKLSIPVTCKIRVFTEIDKTVKYAQMLESAGCQLLTVHGRTKEMKGPLTGLASWKHIQAVKNAVQIPVFANGNIQYKADVDRCLSETGVDGVMIAEGSLHNPMLFVDGTPIVWEMACEYLEFAKTYPPCPLSYVRGHIFKICHHALQKHVMARTKLSNSKNVDDIKEAVALLSQECKSTCWLNSDNNKSKSSLPFPHWICQPYIRPPPNKDSNSKIKPAMKTSDKCVVSKKKMKRLLKRGVIDGIEDMEPVEKAAKIACYVAESRSAKVAYKKCVLCGNPSGIKCVFMCCKPCCKKRMQEVDLICLYHRKHKKNPAIECQSNTERSYANAASI